MVIDERIDDDGAAIRATLTPTADSVVYRSGDDDGLELPLSALARVMRRYGRELDPSVIPDGERLLLAGDHTIQRLRFHARVDAEARDYLVWREPGQPPLAAIARDIATALAFLARRAGASR